MTYTEIRAKVVVLVHGLDSHGNRLLSYLHDERCVFCDRLAGFFEGLLKEEDKYPLPTFEAQGAVSQYLESRHWMDRREKEREEAHLAKFGISRMDLLEEKQKQLAEFVNNEINALKSEYESRRST